MWVASFQVPTCSRSNADKQIGAFILSQQDLLVSFEQSSDDNENIIMMRDPDCLEKRWSRKFRALESFLQDRERWDSDYCGLNNLTANVQGLARSLDRGCVLCALNLLPEIYLNA